MIVIKSSNYMVTISRHSFVVNRFWQKIVSKYNSFSKPLDITHRFNPAVILCFSPDARQCIRGIKKAP